jgi:hypothetical protein
MAESHYEMGKPIPFEQLPTTVYNAINEITRTRWRGLLADKTGAAFSETAPANR